MNYDESIESKNLLFLNSMHYLRKYKPYSNGHKFYRFFYERYLSSKKLISDYHNKKRNMYLTDFFYLLFPKKYYRMRRNFNPDINKQEINYICNNTYKNNKIVIYTSVFGKYDSIKEPLFVNKNIDYVAITDVPISEKSAWKKYDYSKILDFERMDDYHKSKFCKMFPNVFFDDYDISIWVDGNIQIIGDLYPLVDRITQENSIAMFEHPINNCIYKEKESIIYFEKAKPSEILLQINKYKEDNFPSNFGMKECSIIIRKHNNGECKKIMSDWWEQVNLFTMRDQVSLPYVLWKNNKNIDYIQSLGFNWRWNVRLMEYEHNK